MSNDRVKQPIGKWDKFPSFETHKLVLRIPCTSIWLLKSAKERPWTVEVKLIRKSKPTRIRIATSAKGKQVKRGQCSLTQSQQGWHRPNQQTGCKFDQKELSLKAGRLSKF